MTFWMIQKVRFVRWLTDAMMAQMVWTGGVRGMSVRFIPIPSEDVIEFLYEDGIDDISSEAVQIQQTGGDTQINWGGVELNIDGYANFYFQDIRFTMI